MQGRIIKSLAGFYYVESDGVVYQTRARGNFRKKGQTPYVGDFVDFSAEDHSEGYILAIHDRKNSLVRPPIVNIDQAVVIMSAKEPDFNANLLDRFLVLLEHKAIEPIVYISKMDLLTSPDEIAVIQKQYQEIGYQFCTFLDELLPLLTDKVTVFMGQTGVGKSTLLKMITGVVTPTSGTLKVNGKISSLLELGAAFNSELTGIENIYQHGQVMGLTQEQIEATKQDIIDFADIGDHLYQPVKTYSSGMFARLAFACAINVDPDILIVDEVLSVGDMAFQLKCFKK